MKLEFAIRLERRKLWNVREVQKAIHELTREAKIRQFVYPREVSRWRLTRGKEGISEEESMRRWESITTALSILQSLLEFGEAFIADEEDVIVFSSRRKRGGLLE